MEGHLPYWLFQRQWIRVEEGAATAGTIRYLPEEADVPLSRKPRERLELRPDGKAHVLLCAADDRLKRKPATWTLLDDEIVIEFEDAPLRKRTLRVRDWSPDALTVTEDR